MGLHLPVTGWSRPKGRDRECVEEQLVAMLRLVEKGPLGGYCEPPRYMTPT
jgi:hypothetical protein